MLRNMLRVLHKGAHLSPSEIDEWAKNDDGFLHLAFYLSVLIVLLSVTKRVNSFKVGKNVTC
jgi:hypothetical protein